jgi:hypothetical protein
MIFSKVLSLFFYYKPYIEIDMVFVITQTPFDTPQAIHNKSLQAA